MLRIVLLTTLAMTAFAGNSLLCRVVLKQTEIDAASFTTIRLIAGALTLWLLVAMRRDRPGGRETGGPRWRCSFTRLHFHMPMSVFPQRPLPCCCLARCK